MSISESSNRTLLSGPHTRSNDHRPHSLLSSCRLSPLQKRTSCKLNLLSNQVLGHARQFRVLFFPLSEFMATAGSSFSLPAKSPSFLCFFLCHRTNAKDHNKSLGSSSVTFISTHNRSSCQFSRALITLNYSKTSFLFTNFSASFLLHRHLTQLPSLLPVFPGYTSMCWHYHDVGGKTIVLCHISVFPN